MRKLITPNKKINKLLKWSLKVRPFRDEDDVKKYLILFQLDPEQYGFSNYQAMAKYIWEKSKEAK